MAAELALFTVTAHVLLPVVGTEANKHTHTFWYDLNESLVVTRVGIVGRTSITAPQHTETQRGTHLENRDIYWDKDLFWLGKELMF